MTVSYLSLPLLVHTLMYACGDDANPASDTVNVMEEILIEYIEQLVSIQWIVAGAIRRLRVSRSISFT